MSLIFIVVSISGCSSPQRQTLDNKQNIAISSVNTIASASSIDVENFISQNCGDFGNAYMNGCTIQLLDRKAAEREWKQLRIETFTNINKDELFDSLEKEQHKVEVWRNDFEKMRDQWCSATVNFAYGSGTPRRRAECMLGIELLAIHDLDDTNELINSFYNVKINNFEPTNEEVEKIIKTNKITTECVWDVNLNCSNNKK